MAVQEERKTKAMWTWFHWIVVGASSRPCTCLLLLFCSQLTNECSKLVVSFVYIQEGAYRLCYQVCVKRSVFVGDSKKCSNRSESDRENGVNIQYWSDGVALD